MTGQYESLWNPFFSREMPFQFSELCTCIYNICGCIV